MFEECREIFHANNRNHYPVLKNLNSGSGIGCLSAGFRGAIATFHFKKAAPANPSSGFVLALNYIISST